MIPIVSIVGKSNSGKTTLIEKLIPELGRRGHRVATIKHDVHGFEIDHEGKDSWRHRVAGAVQVVLSSPRRVAMIRDSEKDHSPEEIRDLLIRDVDIILCEGYKDSPHPKIEVLREERDPRPLCSKENHLIAVASVVPIDVGVPCLDRDDVEGLADLVETIIQREKGSENP